MADYIIDISLPQVLVSTPAGESAIEAKNYSIEAKGYRDTALSAQSACYSSQTICISAADALNNLDLFVPQGTIDASSNPNFPSASQGDYFIISVSGKVGGTSGLEVNVADMIFALENTISGTFASVGSNWMKISNNLNGVVIGPSVSQVDYVPSFNSTNGKLLKDSNVPISDVARKSQLGTLSTISHPNDSSKVLFGDGVFRTSSSLTLNDVLPYIIALGD